MPLLSAVPSAKTQRYGAQARNYKQITLPSPARGLDVSLPHTNQAPDTALLLDNFLCRRMGVELRRGSHRWATNLGQAESMTEVLSLMAYQPPRGTGSVYESKLFAACSNARLYDVTNQKDEAFVPPVMKVFMNQSRPGIHSWINFSTPGNNFLVVTGAGMGVWTYDHAGGWIDRTADITGTVGAVTSFDFVTVWKNRLWFIQNNTTKAWFLPTFAIAGAASSFDFGALFAHGGELKAMGSWTLDAGDGIDDKLVLIGQGGDVLIYEGTDPTTAATFQLKGRWFTGRPPMGRRFMSKYAGDLVMITESGIEYMSRLTQGAGLLDPQTPNAATPARRFNEVIGSEVRSTRSRQFWQMLFSATQDGVVVLTPANVPNNCHQFFFGTLAQAWSRLTGWPASSMEVFEGELYYGTHAGTVHKAFVGDTDDVLTDGTPGKLPAWELQTSFTPPGDDRNSLKIPKLINTIFQGPTPPEIKVQINTDWSMKSIPGAPPVTAVESSKWDIAKWNQGVWGAETDTYGFWVGAEGLGVYFSLRMSVRGTPGTVFNSWSVIYEDGGIM